jgi:hypothetical protein
MESGEGRAALADRIVYWAVGLGYAAVLAATWREHGLAVCALVLAGLLVVLSGMRYLRRLTLTDSIDDIAASYMMGASAIVNPRTRAHWSRAAGRLVGGAVLIMTAWLVEKPLDDAAWISVGGILLAIAGVLAVVILFGGVGYAIVQIVRTRRT